MPVSTTITRCGWWITNACNGNGTKRWYGDGTRNRCYAGRLQYVDARHARQIRVDGIADDGAAEHDGQRHVERLEAAILDQVAEDDRVTLLVRELEPNPVLSRDRRDDADLLGEGEREVVGERGDLADLRTGDR